MSDQIETGEFKNGTNGINKIGADLKKLEALKSKLPSIDDVNGKAAAMTIEDNQDVPAAEGQVKKEEPAIPEQKMAETQSEALKKSLDSVEKLKQAGKEKLKGGKVENFEEIKIKLTNVKEKGVTFEEKEITLKPEIKKANQELGKAFKEWEAAEKEKRLKWIEIKEKYPAGTVFKNHDGDTIEIKDYKDGDWQMIAQYHQKGSEEDITQSFEREQINGLMAGYKRVEKQPKRIIQSARKEVKMSAEVEDKPENQEPLKITPEEPVKTAEKVKTAPESGEIFSEQEKEILEKYREDITKVLDDIRNKDYVKLRYSTDEVADKIRVEINCVWNSFKEYMINEKQFGDEQKAQKAWELIKKEIG